MSKKETEAEETPAEEETPASLLTELLGSKATTGAKKVYFSFGSIDMASKKYERHVLYGSKFVEAVKAAGLIPNTKGELYGLVGAAFSPEGASIREKILANWPQE